MNREEKKQRFSLTILFAVMVFCVLLVTILIVGITAYILVRMGILMNEGSHLSDTTWFIILISIACLFIGTLITAVLGKFPLKPVNHMINAMNRLAAGDYKVRIVPTKLLNRIPASKELAESFNTMAAELESTEMLRSDFINNFSHEFKTPIVSIAGFAKLLNRGNLSEEQKREYISVIAEESMRLSSMATNVLNLTKVENQTILTDVTKYNLSEQLRSSILLLEEKWSKKNLDFSVEFGEHTVSANEELLKQVWINLIDNAIKFADEGSTIEISIKEYDKSISVSVLNKGPEISPEHQKRIFNKFYQADESHSTEGNGVGLAIVKRIVDLHNGNISVMSENGVTMFTVELPK